MRILHCIDGWHSQFEVCLSSQLLLDSLLNRSQFLCLRFLIELSDLEINVRVQAFLLLQSFTLCQAGFPGDLFWLPPLALLDQVVCDYSYSATMFLQKVRGLTLIEILTPGFIGKPVNILKSSSLIFTLSGALYILIIPTLRFIALAITSVE